MGYEPYKGLYDHYDQLNVENIALQAYKNVFKIDLQSGPPTEGSYKGMQQFMIILNSLNKSVTRTNHS